MDFEKLIRLLQANLFLLVFYLAFFNPNIFPNKTWTVLAGGFALYIFFDRLENFSFYQKFVSNIRKKITGVE